MMGIEASPGFHQPRKGMPSLDANSASATESPTDSGVFGPRSGKRKRLFVIRKEAPTGRTTNRTSATSATRAISTRTIQRLRVARFILVQRRSWQERCVHLHLEPRKLL